MQLRAIRDVPYVSAEHELFRKALETMFESCDVSFRRRFAPVCELNGGVLGAKLFGGGRKVTCGLV